MTKTEATIATPSTATAPVLISQIFDAPGRGLLPNISPHSAVTPQLYGLDAQPIEQITELLQRQYLSGHNATFVKWTAKKGATIFPLTCIRVLSSGGRDNRFLDLRDGVVFGQAEVDVRHVRQLVSYNDTIDDRGSLDRKGLGDHTAQFIRMFCLEPLGPAGTRERNEIRVREFNCLPKRWKTYALGFQEN